MQVIFSPLYAWPRSGLGICELLPVLPQKQPFFDSQAQNEKKAGGNICETTGKIGTGPTPVSERMYRTIPRICVKVKPENEKS
jgi:hypothetical protein